MANKIGNSYSSALARYYANLSNEKKSAKAQKNNTESDSTQVKSASDELKYLQDKFKGYSIVSVDYRQGMQYGKNNTTNVAISPTFLKKMADDPELQAKYEKEIANMAELDSENVRKHAASGSRIKKQGWAIDKNGGISCWSVGTRVSSSKNTLALGLDSLSTNSSKKKSTQNSIFSALTSSTGRRTSTAAKKFALKYGLSSTSSSDISDKLAEIRKSLNLKI